MYVVKFKLKDKNDIFTPICKKYNIDFFTKPYSYYIKNKMINYIGAGYLRGSEKDKLEFIKDLKKDKRIKNIEQNFDFLFLHIVLPYSKETEYQLKIFYNPELIIYKPIFNSKDGWEYWNVGCLNKSILTKLVSIAKKYHNGVLFYIRKEVLKNIGFFDILPNISDKQISTLEFAYRFGYYKYPRKITITKLAKLYNKSYSAFQESLKRGENNILDFFLKYKF